MNVYRFILEKKAGPIFSTRRLCDLFRVSRSAMYRWHRTHQQRALRDAKLLVHIRASHRRSRETYGSPRILADLRDGGIEVGRSRVARIMRENSIAGRPKKRFRATTQSRHRDPVSPNLLQRNFETEAPDVAWVGDITYFRVVGGFAYVAVLIDLFSRKVVGWSVADHMRTSLCLEALHQACQRRRPEGSVMHHTDRGSQYASKEYQERLASMGFVSSMSRKGDCWDNAVAESFFGSLKQELTSRVYADVDELRRVLEDHINVFYNQQRRHSHNGQMSPVAYELRYQANARKAA